MLILPVAVADSSAADDSDKVIVLKAARIHTVSGDPIDGGVVIIRAGRIEAVGRDLPVPDQARVIELADGVVTPGLIDACCAVNFEIPQAAASRLYGSDEQPSFWRTLVELQRRRQTDEDRAIDPEGGGSPSSDMPEGLAAATPPNLTWAEHASEVTPHRLVSDSLNLFSNDFARLVKGGVTTVYVSPDSASVIGSRGTVVKTAGRLSERVVRRADAVKATMGSDPSRRGRSNRLPPGRGRPIPPSFHTRRPTTRMGVEWVFRKAFYDAQRAREGLELYGADMPPRQALPVLQQVLDGEIPLRIQARMQHDVFTALRLAAEFKLEFVLEEATEAYRCLPQLQAADVPVVFGPTFMAPTGYRRYTGEADRPRLNTPKQLADTGIEFALTAQELRDEEGLLRQGMYAVRYGLSPEQALRAITATPAALLGLSDQLGVVAPGAAADLVVWNTEPFDATSRPLLVMIDGRVVYEDQSPKH
jgi:imidazolonepropionase-like amidohydrolase